MSKIVRSSKYRHVFGTVAQKDKCFDEVKVTRSAWDSNYISANSSMLAVVAESGGGGAFYVLPFGASGKVDPKIPMVNGHKSPVMDVEWSPFIESLVASASEDGTAKIWNIPEGGLKEAMSEPAQSLVAHKRKVGTVNFHPTANNVLATSSADFAVKVWDIEKGKDVISVDAQHSDLIQSVQWSPNGALLATAAKDKKLRVIDPRTNKVIAEGEHHQGVKGSRVVWLSEKRLFTSGFSKTSDREYCLWDTKDLSKPLLRTTVDSGSGLLMPFFDPDTAMLYLAGKGDGNIRYYEIVDEEPYIHFLTEFKSNTPLRGGCMLPKRSVNVSDCEVARFFKVGVKLIEPIAFQVPRKSEVFQDDIYPDCIAGEPALQSADWFGGKNAEPKRQSMAPGFVSKPRSDTVFNPDKQVEDKPLSEKELRDEYEKLKKRVAYLESELVKRDAKIKELGGH